jgi:hypothetical protein
MHLRYYYGIALKGKNLGKLAFLVHTFSHAQLNDTFKDSLSIMTHEIFSRPFAFAIGRNNMLLGHFNYFIDRLIPAGIMKHLINYGVWNLFRPLVVESVDNRRILSLQDLEFGFVIWLVAISVCFQVFLYETILALRIRRWLRKLIGLVEFLRVLRARMADYHDGW